MNRKLSYGGKTLEEMTTNELKAQCRTNRNRLKRRILFFVVITVLTFFVVPFAAPIHGAIGAVTTFWLLQNNKAIHLELGRRR